MIELTEQQRQVLENVVNPRFVNPATKEEFVLVRAQVFDRIQSLLADDWSDEGFAAAMEVFAKDGWADPAMDVYDALDPRRAPAFKDLPT